MPVFRFCKVLVLCLVGFYSYSQDTRFDIRISNNDYQYTLQEVPGSLESRYAVNLSNIPGLSFQWEKSSLPLSGFVAMSGETNEDLGFNAPLDGTTYFRRKSMHGGNTFYSNVVGIEIVSVFHEPMNYKREHVIRREGISSWEEIDEMEIGRKLQTTMYTDGLGRPIQQVGREMGKPLTADPQGVYSDVVAVRDYDGMGREVKEYLPYSTSADAALFKTSSLAAQESYHDARYGETTGYVSYTFDGSPMHLPVNVKAAGAAWKAGAGNSSYAYLNTKDDGVRIFKIPYASGSVPVVHGIYDDYTLTKLEQRDQLGKKTVDFYDKSGLLILRKVQLEDNAVEEGYDGWLCTYSVYDEFGLLRATIEPEAVHWLKNNGWSFASTDGAAAFNGWCYVYEYDDKGQTILKKTPGADPLMMIYNKRGLPVFMQDGTQRKMGTPQWTVNLYDDLDRVVLSTLYHTSLNNAQLQEVIDGASNATITVSNIGGGGPQLDLLVDHRDVTVTSYEARNSIEFVNGFESVVGDEFVGQIDPGAVRPPVTVTLPANNHPLAPEELNDPGICTILRYNYYDHYEHGGVIAFSTTFSNGEAYATGGDAIMKSERVWSMPTGSRVRILESDEFLHTSFYYDEKGRLVQSLSENMLGGRDILTRQYSFDNLLLSVDSRHSSLGTGYSSYSIVTKHIYDKPGRLTAVEKKFGANAFKRVAEYSPDDLGRLEVLRLSPGYTGITGRDEMEELKYSFNINGSLTGINKDYALKTPGQYNKWGNFFGQYFEYENKDGLFASSRLDGKQSGTVWNTQGDDAQRFYDYEYDAAGRFTAATFTERQTPGGAANGAMNFSVAGNNNGKIGYDRNGNIQSLIQMGVMPGNTTPVQVDNLAYTYESFSNKLKALADNGTLGTNNGKLGDFKHAPGGNGIHYAYDDNGNMNVDYHKSAIITYNHLDKPREVNLSGKGVITYVYDADGNRLQRTFTPSGAGAAVTTTYVNEYVFIGDELQYISFEEGRLRVTETVSDDNGFDFISIDGNIDLPGSKRGAFDYYVKDNLGNVRMMVTEQTHIGGNTCTMETGRAANEETVFGKTDVNGNPVSGNEVAARYATANIPGQSTNNGWRNNTIGNHVSRLGSQSSSGKLGPNSLLKVMAGDEVSATTLYYYQNNVVNTNSGNNLLSSIISALTGAISSSAVTDGVTKGAATNITNNLNTNGLFNQATAPDAVNAAGTMPKAYLTVLFFDERFNFVEEGSVSERVLAIGDMPDPHDPAPLDIIAAKAPKNGYAYIYVSNESDEHVYFDNLQVTHERGRLIEENHYYAYGLKIAGISSRKLNDPREGHLKNFYQYQGEYSEWDEDLGWTDFFLRSYDAQIGRFWQMDPYDQFSSPFTGMGNDPVNMIDPTGGWAATGIFTGLSSLEIIGVTTLMGAIAGGAIDQMSGGNGGKGLMYGALAGLGSNIVAFAVVQIANLAINIPQNEVSIQNILKSKPELSNPDNSILRIFIKHGKSKNKKEGINWWDVWDGHTILQVDEKFYHFIPKDSKKGKDKSGKSEFSQTWHSDGSVEEMTFEEGRNYLSEDEEAGYGFSVFEKQITISQKEKLIREIDKSGKKPPSYKTFGTRCQSWVSTMLRKTGILSAIIRAFSWSTVPFRKALSKTDWKNVMQKKSN